MGTIAASTRNRASRALCALACTAALVGVLGPTHADEAAAVRARNRPGLAADDGAPTVVELTRELAARAGELTS